MLVNSPAHFNPHTSISLGLLKCAVQVCGLVRLRRRPTPNPKMMGEGLPHL
jgi:hypothetical protein